MTKESKAMAPSVLWRQINGMRNRLIHAYFDINRDEVWKTIVEDLPVLERELMAVLDEERGSDDQ